jgi:hypothetical protein
MTATNGRNLAGFAALINDSGKVIAEAFSTDLAAATRPTVYDSDGDVPFDAPKGSQAYVASEGLLLKLTDAAWYVLDGSEPEPEFIILTGSTSGYITSGILSANTIRKFPFASSSSATQVGLLTISTSQTGGVSSKQDGYSVGGWTGAAQSDVISKWPFSSDGNATNVGSLTLARYILKGANSATYGYAASGLRAGVGAQDTIDKWAFATDGNATDVGNVAPVGGYAAGASASSEENGYLMGGTYNYSGIRKWSFTSDGNSTAVGNITIGRQTSAGIFSSEHGYTTGGVGAGIPVTNARHIDRFPFAADGNAVGTGDLTAGRYGHVTASATTHGYVSGAYSSGAVNSLMSRFAHGSSTTDVDIGTLAVASKLSAGHQV